MTADLTEPYPTQIIALRCALQAGEASGLVDYSLQNLLQELDRDTSV
jgi:hypothetical protein